MFIQAFIPEFTVEALDVRILRWLAWLNQLQLYAMLISPLIECPAGKLWPLVCPDSFGVASEACSLIQHPCHLVARNTQVDNQVDCFLGAVVVDGQDFDPTTV